MRFKSFTYYSSANFLIFVSGAISFLASELVSHVGADQAVFYDEANYQGNSLTLSITGGCYRFKRKWTAKSVSVEVPSGTSCLMVWREDDCSGKSIRLTPKTDYNWDLRKIGFDNQIRSVSLCHEISFRLIGVDDRMLGPHNGDDDDDDDFFKDDVWDATKKVDVDFYDEPNFGGNILTVTTSGFCYTFKPKWSRKVNSIDLAGKCMTLWDGPECEGQSITLNSEQAKDLRTVDFDRRAKSLRLCKSSLRSSSRPLSRGNKDDIDEGYGSSSGSLEDDPNNDRFRFNADGGRNRGGTQSSVIDDVVDSVPDDEVARIALDEHNRLRRLHRVPDLTWDIGIQRQAQSFAKSLALSNKFHHSNDNELGENLGGVSEEDKITALKEVIELWYNEIDHYNFNNPSRSVKGMQAGHFTQIVWKSTTSMGLGMAWNPRRKWWVIVARYSPAGNFKGEYELNVFPPVRRTSSSMGR